MSGPDDRVITPSRACTCCVRQIAKGLSLFDQAIEAVKQASNHPGAQIALVSIPTSIVSGGVVVEGVPALAISLTSQIPAGAGVVAILAGGLTLVDLAMKLGDTRTEAIFLETHGQVWGTIQDRLLRRKTSDCIECMRQRALSQKNPRGKVTATYYRRA